LGQRRLVLVPDLRDGAEIHLTGRRRHAMALDVADQRRDALVTGGFDVLIAIVLRELFLGEIGPPGHEEVMVDHTRLLRFSACKEL
jgi:hypothetical protein